MGRPADATAADANMVASAAVALASALVPPQHRGPKLLHTQETWTLSYVLLT